MAYWNPFGWDEETRRSIQSIVRPVMQVASMAASMGAFSGGGAAAAKTGTTDGAAQAAAGIGDVGPSFETVMDLPTDFGTSYGADALNPNNPAFTDMPTGSLEMSGGFKEQAARNFSQPTQIQQEGLVPDSMLQGSLDNQYFKGSEMLNNPSVTFQPQETAMIDGQQILDMPQSDVKGMLEADNAMNIKPLGTDQAPGQATITDKPPKTTEQITQQPTTTTRQVVNEGAATSTPDKPEIKPKPKPKDGPGPGGKEEPSSWAEVFDKGFTWENIEKFLKSKEGLKWLLIDEKGFAGIGRKLTAAADAGTTGFTALTPEERKKILKRLKKEREERKKERRNR